MKGGDPLFPLGLVKLCQTTRPVSVPGTKRMFKEYVPYRAKSVWTLQVPWKVGPIRCLGGFHVGREGIFLGIRVAF